MSRKQISQPLNVHSTQKPLMLLLLLFLVLAARHTSWAPTSHDAISMHQAFVALLDGVPTALAWLSGIITILGMTSQILLATLNGNTAKRRTHLWCAAGTLTLGTATLWAALVWLPNSMAI